MSSLAVIVICSAVVVVAMYLAHKHWPAAKEVHVSLEVHAPSSEKTDFAAYRTNKVNVAVTLSTAADKERNCATVASFGEIRRVLKAHNGAPLVTLETTGEKTSHNMSQLDKEPTQQPESPEGKRDDKSSPESKSPTVDSCPKTLIKTDDAKALQLSASSELLRAFGVSSDLCTETVPQQYVRLKREPAPTGGAKKKHEAVALDWETTEAHVDKTGDDATKKKSDDDGQPQRLVVPTETSTVKVAGPPKSLFKYLRALRDYAVRSGASSVDVVDFDTTSPLDMDKVKSAEEAISKYSGVLFGGGVDLTEGNKSVDSGARQWWSTAQSREEAVRKHLLPLRDAVTMSTAWSDLPVLRKVDFAAAEKAFQEQKVQLFTFVSVPRVMEELEVLAENDAVWRLAYGSKRSLMRDQRELLNTPPKYYLRAMCYDVALDTGKLIMAWCDRAKSYVMLGLVPLGQDPTGKFDLGVGVRELFYMPGRYNSVLQEWERVDKDRGRALIAQHHRPGQLSRYFHPEVGQDSIKFAFRT